MKKADNQNNNEENNTNQEDTNTQSDLSVEEQVAFYKSEAQKAFQARDEYKSKLAELQSNNPPPTTEPVKDETQPGQYKNADLLAMVKDYQNKYQELADREQKRQEQDKYQKQISATIEVAKQMGLKEHYQRPEAIERIVNVANVNPNESVSAKIALQSAKDLFPDMFSQASRIPAPTKLSTDNSSMNYLQQEYEQAVKAAAENPNSKELMNKAGALKRDIDRLMYRQQYG